MKALPLVQRSSPFILIMVLVLATFLAPVAQAGSSTNPEIRDSNTDSARTLGAVSQPWEITKGWIGKEDEILVFTLELAGSPEMPPANAVYAWHFTWGAFRFFWMMNVTEAGPTFSGGTYQGTPNIDRYGSTQFQYITSPALGDNLTGGFDGGPNARITWRYDANNFGKPGEEPIFFSGMAVYAYQVEERQLVMIDAANGDDYTFIVLLPWHERLLRQIPGPSPVAVVVGALALVVVATRHRRNG